MEKMDEGLKTLLDLGKRRGFLTFDQVNDFLPISKRDVTMFEGAARAWQQALAAADQTTPLRLESKEQSRPGSRLPGLLLFEDDDFLLAL